MKKAVFIGSVSHSGSTMLNYVLGNNDKCFALGECYAIFRPHKRHHFVAAGGDFSSACSCKEKECVVWSDCLKERESGFYSFLWKSYDVLVDSSKHIDWYERMQEYYAGECEFEKVLIYKHPVDVLLSFYKRQNFMQNWSRAYYEYYSSFLKKLGANAIVSYYDFVKNPAEMTKEICARIKIPYVEKQEEYWNGKYHFLFGKDHTLQHKEFYIDNSWKEKKFEIYQSALDLFKKLEEKKVVV